MEAEKKETNNHGYVLGSGNWVDGEGVIERLPGVYILTFAHLKMLPINEMIKFLKC